MNPKNKTVFWLTFALSAVLLASACGMINQAMDTVEKGKNAAATMQAVATSADDVIGQVKDMATEVSGSGFMETAAAAITEIADSGMLETMQAMVTELPDNAQDAQATMQALVDENHPEPPRDDIPVVPGELETPINTGNLVSYSTGMSFQEVVDFYLQEMPAKGWEKQDNGYISGTNSIFYFTKENSQAMVAIIGDKTNKKTIVTITITGK